MRAEDGGLPSALDFFDGESFADWGGSQRYSRKRLDAKLDGRLPR